MNSQIITVAFESAKDSTAALNFYDRINGVWECPIRNEAVFCGKNGFAKEKTEGDMTTPIGIFNIPFGFGVPLDGLKIDYVSIADHVWVDDPRSGYYNTIQPRDDSSKWSSAEQLNVPYYKYCLVVDYNLQKPIPYKGSAIFVHCKSGRPYTHGCVAMDEEPLKKMLGLLDRRKHPVIVIDHYRSTI